ncbi:MAG: hypothetical protein ACRDYZ_16485 [Acidimicrobiales bacterium]
MLSRISALLAASLLLPLMVLMAAAPTAAAATTSPSAHTTGYWLVASDGGIFSFGGAQFYGSMGGHPLNEPIVGMAGTPTGHGYWQDASDGGIFAFGNAGFYGSMGGKPLNKPIVGMAATPTGQGYWEVASDGGTFSFGSAQFYGSMGGKPLNKPIVGMAAMPTGGGYWMVASDGGIFSFGTAQFYGSMGGKHLNQPITGMAAAPTGHGYWELATDGGMFTYGAATFRGSLGGVPQSRPIVAMTALYQDTGYWVTNSNGLVSNFGTATYWGSTPQVLNAPIVGMTTAVGNGDPGNTAYPSGSYGYDVSHPQCANATSSKAILPNLPHQVGVVGVVGPQIGSTNPCLITEASWAGGGLSLYTFLRYNTAATSADAACANTATAKACNFGFNFALTSFTAAKQAGITPLVPWWLDIEGKGQFWTTNVTDNAAVVQGALDGLRSQGVNSVGFYFSAAQWNTIVGNFNPPGPLWIASWTVTPKYTCTTGRGYWASAHKTWPSGPVELVQYTDNSNGFDGDYAC